MNITDDQAAGLRQLFGVAARTIGWIDCLAAPLDREAVNMRARQRKLEFVADSRRDSPFYVVLFEANEPGVLTAYTRLKALGAQKAAARPLYAWSRTARSQQQRLVDNLVSAAREFLALGVMYQGALDLTDPDGLATLVERIAVLASCDHPSAQRCVPEYNL